MVLPGGFPVHDLVDLHVHIPEGDYTTIAGVVLHALGALPEVGEAVQVARWRIEVLGVERRAITEVRLVPLGPAPGEGDDGDEGDRDRAEGATGR